MQSLAEPFLKPHSQFWNEPHTIFLLSFGQWWRRNFIYPSRLFQVIYALNSTISVVVDVKDIIILRDETKESCKPPAVSKELVSITQHKGINQVSWEVVSYHRAVVTLLVISWNTSCKTFTNQVYVKTVCQFHVIPKTKHLSYQRTWGKFTGRTIIYSQLLKIPQRAEPSQWGLGKSILRLYYNIVKMAEF